MPTYEYECTSCGQHIEVFQRISEDPLTICGVCRGPLRKVFHPAGILFKGSGFYATDSRSGSKRDGDGGSSSSSEGDSKSSESKASEGSSKDSGGGTAKGSEGGSSSSSKAKESSSS
jgi:putative FmdB family regulatory protein